VNKLKYVFIIAQLGIFIQSASAATETIISGHDSTYAGQEIVFYKYADQISNAEAELAKCLVDSRGSFSLKFSLDEITFVFAYVGIYKIHLYAVPGKNYEIILPPRKEKEEQDFLNPYFMPTLIHLGTMQFDPDELNTLIRMFNDSYLPYYNKHIVTLNEKKDYAELDKDIARIEKPFASSKNAFFNDYRRYRYGLIKYLAYQEKSKSISNDYFKNKPVLLNNLAYMELFNKVYDKYFYHYSNSAIGKSLAENISNHDLNALRKTLSADEVLGNGDLLDLVILKCLHDEFYDDNYSRSALLEILDTLIKTEKTKALVEVAKSIRTQVTRLLAGFEPPDFQLYDRDSNLVSLESFRGKYVYLNFCSCFSYTCMNEFKMLSTLYENHKDLLEIVTILVDNDKDVINSFLERSNYPWSFLHYGNQSEIIREYDVRAFPTYYLIDPKGKLAMSPAPAPSEDFEARFFKLLRERGEL
jgi:peroxiredoxin